MRFSNLIVALNLFALVGLLVFSGCGSDDSPIPQGTISADAGPDQSVELGDEVTFDGSSSSSSDGSSLSYLWVISDAPTSSTVTLNNATNVNPTFTPDVTGTYTVTLTVANQSGDANDEVIITVEDGAPQTQELGGTIDTNMTLEDIFTDPEMPDYIVVSNITLSAILTVDPGVVVHVDEDLQINVAAGGVLDANGTSTNNVVFTSSNVPGGQFWKGILVRSSDQRNSLEFTEVSYGGNSAMAFSGGTDYATNIGLDEGGYMNMENSDISNGMGYGLFVHDDDSDLGDFANNTFNDNVTAIGLNAFHISKLDANTTFANNSEEKVQVLASVLASSETATWPALSGDAAYFVSGDIDFEGNLTISEGARFEMGENVTLYVAENAQFVASGSSGNEIVFTSNNIGGGIKWHALTFRSSNTNNLLNFVEVSHAGNTTFPFAGGTDYKTNIGLDEGGFVNITNSTISNSDGYGILVHDDASDIGDFSSNTIANNQTGIGLRANHVESLDGATAFSGNVLTQVEIFGSTLESTKTSTWNDLNGSAKYTISDDINIDGNLTIAAGAYFESIEDIFIRVDGSIDANGASGNEITFTSTSGVKWQGLFVSSSNAGNSLDYVIIDRAGFTTMPFPGTDYKCNLGIDDLSFLSITNCTITNSDGYGVAVDQGASSNAFLDPGANNTFSGNTTGNTFFE